jgi:hypothetical protein
LGARGAGARPRLTLAPHVIASGGWVEDRRCLNKEAGGEGTRCRAASISVKTCGPSGGVLLNQQSATMQGEVARDARGIEEGRIVILQNLLRESTTRDTVTQQRLHQL